MSADDWSEATRLVRGGIRRSSFDETAEAIYATSGFVYSSAEEAEAAFAGDIDRYIYGRYGNPTVSMFEERLRLIEGADVCRATASGMAAVFAAMASFLKASDKVVAARALFGSCSVIITDILPRFGIETVLVDGRDLAQWEAALTGGAQAVFLETPSNPGLEIIDLVAVAELAHAAGEDPLAFRRRMLADHPRHLACLDLVERHASWGAPAPGRTQGVAVYESFDSVVAHVAEVSVEGDAFRVERVVCAVHCGQALNPDVVRAQIAGGTVFGLTAAIKSAVHFVDGVPQETNFDRYAMIRNHESPEVEVHIVPSDDPPTGVGEPGTPGIAAAVANALYAATGKRLRELPLRLEA